VNRVLVDETNTEIKITFITPRYQAEVILFLVPTPDGRTLAKHEVDCIYGPFLSYLFVVYLTTLSVALTIQRRIIG
jgi:hypothetical protein